jgi:hypothetical protein
MQLRSDLLNAGTATPRDLEVSPGGLLQNELVQRIASTMFWPCETRTSTCRSFATISTGLYRFLAIAVLPDVKDIKSSRLSTRQAFVAGTSMEVDHSVTMRANRKCRRKVLSRRKIPRFNLRLNAPSGFPLKIASIKTEAVLGKRGNAGFSGKSRAASVEIESTINPTGLRSGAGCQ